MRYWLNCDVNDLVLNQERVPARSHSEQSCRDAANFLTFHPSKPINLTNDLWQKLEWTLDMSTPRKTPEFTCIGVLDAEMTVKPTISLK